MRKIIHVDMDAFYASVEQRDFPELRGKPVAVGGDGQRGVVAAASYEARKFGVRSAIASSVAKRLCPDLIFVNHRFDVYRNVSNQIREIFFEYTDLVEPLSLDEAYLDVTRNKKNMQSATLIAKEIRKRIFETTQLTASAGVSINKFLAKTASDVNKPNGFFLIPPEAAERYVEEMPIERFYGVGKVTAKKMRDMGIGTGWDLKQLSLEDLKTKFGKVGSYYYSISRAIDNREVQPNRIRKSLGAEQTFTQDLKTSEEVLAELDKIASEVYRRAKKSNTEGKTLMIKIKYADFQQITRSKTLPTYIQNQYEMEQIYNQIISGISLKEGVRLLGLSLSNLNHEIENKEVESNNSDDTSPTTQLTLEF